MGGSEAEQVCKMHPYHHQKQGVCPSCLRERLSQLYNNSYNKATMVVPSCSSSISSSPGSSSNHKPPFSHRHQRNISDVLGSISFRVSVGNGLKKSRSMAFPSRNLVGEAVNGKKKKGFWSKLLHLKGNKAVLRSVTMKERLY